MLEITGELLNVAGVDLRSLSLHKVGSAHLATHLGLQLLVVEGLVSLGLTMSLLKFLDPSFKLLNVPDVVTFLLSLLILQPVHFGICLDSSLSIVLGDFCPLNRSFLLNNLGDWFGRLDVLGRPNTRFLVGMVTVAAAGLMVATAACASLQGLSSSL